MAAVSASLLAWAQSYAERGWPVLPLYGVRDADGELVCRCRAGATCEHPGKHPCAPVVPHGLNDATTDIATVTAWWERAPRCNIGCVTGVAFDTLDVDHDDFLAGTDDLPPCETKGGPVAVTGRGRFHLLFAATGIGRRIRFSAHCDWLGVGGYQVMAPSRVPQGEYRWFAPLELPLQRPPVELLMMLDPPKPTPPVATRVATGPRRATADGWSPTGLFGKMATAVEGQRNATLHWCAARVGDDVGAGKVDETTALQALEQLAGVARQVGLADREIAATIRSGYRP